MLVLCVYACACVSALCLCFAMTGDCGSISNICFVVYEPIRSSSTHLVFLSLSGFHVWLISSLVVVRRSEVGIKVRMVVRGREKNGMLGRRACRSLQLTQTNASVVTSSSKVVGVEVVKCLVFKAPSPSIRSGMSMSKLKCWSTLRPSQ